MSTSELTSSNGREWNTHPHGGGQVAVTAYVAPTAYVGPHARVTDHARVTGHAKILDHAVIADRATVAAHATVAGHAYVAGDAIVSGHAEVLDNAQVIGHAVVAGITRVSGSEEISQTNLPVARLASVLGEAKGATLLSALAGTATLASIVTAILNERQATQVLSVSAVLAFVAALIVLNRK